MVWGCMGLYGEEWMGKLVKIEGKMDAKQFCGILEDSLMESIETLGIEEEEYYIQQDNNSNHTSKKAKKWSENNSIQVIFQPAQFPDLNPIEFLWEHFKCQLYQYKTPLERVHELWNQVSEE